MKSTKTDRAHILIIGVGNVSRGDDAMGWNFVSDLQKCYDFDFEYRYQLQVEDSELICHYEKIVIIDASHDDLPEGYEIKICQPAPHYYFSSHAQKADTILYITNEVYGVYPELYTLGISGYQWELDAKTTDKAQQNFEKALNYFKDEFLNSNLMKESVFVP